MSKIEEIPTKRPGVVVMLALTAKAFEITSTTGYRCTLPRCTCDRAACVKAYGHGMPKGGSKAEHGRTHCHRLGGHVEQARAFALKVAATYRRTR